MSEYTWNQKLHVKDDHKFHPGREGYFQFMGGPDKNVVVLTDKPVRTRMLRRKMINQSYFAVSPEDIMKEN